MSILYPSTRRRTTWGGRQQNVTRRVLWSGPTVHPRAAIWTSAQASVRSVPTGGKAQGLPRRRGPMVAGSRTMGRGHGLPRPGTAAFPNFAGQRWDAAILPLFFAGGHPKLGGEEAGPCRHFHGSREGCVAIGKASRTGQHRNFSGRGMASPPGPRRPRHRSFCSSTLLTSSRDPPVAPLSSPLVLAPLDRLCSILSWPRPTPSSSSVDSSSDPPHGPIVPGRKWMDAKGDTACGPRPSRIKLRQDGRVFHLCPALACGSGVGRLTASASWAISGGQQWRRPFSGRQETSPLQICHDVALNGLSSRQRAKRFPPHFQALTTRTGQYPRRPSAQEPTSVVQCRAFSIVH